MNVLAAVIPDGPQDRSGIHEPQLFRNAGKGGSRLSLRSAGMTSYMRMPGTRPGMTEFGLRPLPAQVLADRHALWLERLAQHRNAGIRVGTAAHENVDRG